MAFYGADVEALREFGRQLAAGADSLDDARRALQSRVTAVRWGGPDGDHVRSQWSGELGPSLAGAAATLRHAADRIRANAADQERTSSAGGGGVAGGHGGGTTGGTHGGGAHGGAGDDDSAAGGSKVDVKDSHKVTLGGEDEDAAQGTDAKLGGGVKYDPETGETTYSGNGSLEQWAKGPGDSKVTFGVNGGADYTTGEKTEDGFTTYTSKSDVSIGVSGGGEVKGYGLDGGRTWGVEAEYKVKVPEGADVDPASINPFDPHSIPVGGSVTSNGGDYVKTELNGAFHQIAVDSSVKDSSGVSSVVERIDDDTVRVTAGPTDALVNKAGLGLDVFGIKAMLTGTETFNGSTVRTADFDISTPEGAAAYAHYQATGELPGSESAGVSGTTKIQRLDYDDIAKLGIETPVGAVGDTEIGHNSGSKVMTTYPDGSAEMITNAKYGDTGDFRMEQSFDASGKEDMSSRTYSYQVTANDLTAQYLNSGDWFPQGSVPDHVSAGEKVTLTFTEAQMERLAGYAERADPTGDNTGLLGDKMTAFDLARNFAINSMDEQELIDRISRVYQSR